MLTDRARKGRKHVAKKYQELVVHRCLVVFELEKSNAAEFGEFSQCHQCGQMNVSLTVTQSRHEEVL